MPAQTVTVLGPGAAPGGSARRASGASGHPIRGGTTENEAPARARAAKGDHLMAVVTMKQLLESGVHFGHQTRRWNPKMKRYILTERNGIYIIDLQQSLSYIDRA